MAIIQAFHGSKSEIKSFSLYTHFGSCEAAKMRLDAKYSGESVFIYEVELYINNPLEITDDQANNNPSMLLTLARHNDVIPESVCDTINDAINRSYNDNNDELLGCSTFEYPSKKFEIGMRPARPALIQLGFDGFVYENTAEEGRSYIIFDPAQASIIGKTCYTAKPK